MDPPASTVSFTIQAGETPTFSIFATAQGQIPFDPAGSRIFVRFERNDGEIVGSTSVAVTTM